MRTTGADKRALIEAVIQRWATATAEALGCKNDFQCASGCGFSKLVQSLLEMWDQQEQKLTFLFTIRSIPSTALALSRRGLRLQPPNLRMLTVAFGAHSLSADR